MIDVLTKKQRSYCMSRIHGKNTRPEMALRKYLRCAGLTFRTNARLPGRPDIVFPEEKTVVFVDGCFWHKCPRCFVKPATRANFWMKKISGNVKRDKLINHELKRSGWKVIRVWEHQIRRSVSATGDGVLRKIQRV